MDASSEPTPMRTSTADTPTPTVPTATQTGPSSAIPMPLAMVTQVGSNGVAAEAVIDLPLEIKLNIFSRLPVECVLDCKLVCKAWRRELLQFPANDTYFANLQLRYQYGVVQQQQHKPFTQYHYGSDPETVSLLGFQRYPPALWYFEYYDGTDKGPNHCIKKMNVELPVDVHGLVGSDNGLICLTARTEYNGIPGEYGADEPYEPLYICNPITREFLKLPRILIDEKKSIHGVHIVYGFGYHPFTNKYKVVRICYVGNPETPSFKGQVEVYTLGSGKGWKHAGETNYYLWPRCSYSGYPAGFYANGALHWPCDKSADIVAFDLADEKFHVLRTPPNTYNDILTSNRTLSVMRQCLCLQYWKGVPSLELELWVLKRNKEENSSRYHMNEQSWSWSRELVIPSIFNRWRIFSLVNRGEVLLTDGRKVVRCNSNQGPKSSTKIMELNLRFSSWFPSHVNSFVSLEALGERNVKKLEAERPVSPAGQGKTEIGKSQGLRSSE